MVRQTIKLLYFLPLTILMFGSSCYYDNEEELYGNEPCDTTNISYAQMIEPIINSQCATVGCHVANGSANGIFESYANVKTKVDNGSFANRVIDVRDMPPGGNLNDCQINLFQAWLDAGAPNN